MASCPGCGAQLTVDTCPRCVGVPLDGDAPAAERQRRRPDWLVSSGPGPGPDAASGAAEEPGPVVVATPEPEEHGYLPAAAIFGAQGVASLLLAGVGAPPDLLTSAACLITAAMLLKGAGWAKWLVLVGALLGAGKESLEFVLTGSWGAIPGALSSLCVLGAFWLETPRQRLAAAAAGVLLAFGWFGLMAARPAEGSDDALAEYALPGGRYSDPAAGLAVAAPPELTLFDLQRMRADLGGKQGGLLGLLASEGVSLEGADQRVLARSEQDEVVAIVSMGALPPQVATESVLPTLLGGGARARRDDGLVPRPLRVSGLATQAWRDPTRRVLLARSPDGRLATVVCRVHQRAAERLCAALFAGVALELRGRPPRAGEGVEAGGPD